MNEPFNDEQQKALNKAIDVTAAALQLAPEEIRQAIDQITAVVDWSIAVQAQRFFWPTWSELVEINQAEREMKRDQHLVWANRWREKKARRAQFEAMSQAIQEISLPIILFAESLPSVVASARAQIDQLAAEIGGALDDALQVMDDDQVRHWIDRERTRRAIEDEQRLLSEAPQPGESLRLRTMRAELSDIYEKTSDGWRWRGHGTEND